jgi:calcineurin-like phosphoesterase family protein
MNKIWLSSDFHFGHKNIASKNYSQWDSGWRNFVDVNHMNETILDNINTLIQPDDTLYFLGDFCFGGHAKTPYWRERINCKTIHVCRGNHDKKIDLYANCFNSIQNTLTVNYQGKEIFCSHYSHRIWEGSHKGVLHAWGHSHGNAEPFGKSMDVGIDYLYKIFNQYQPILINDFIDIVDSFPITQIDHHDKQTNR